MHFSYKDNSLDVIRLTKLPRVFRLIRFFRLFKMIRFLTNSTLLSSQLEMVNINPGYIRLGKTLAQVFFICHITSCFWFLTAKLSGFSNESWVFLGNYQDDDPGTQYMTSLYWVSQTITTVGFGDMSIGLNVEYLFATAWMLVGNIYYGFAVG